MNWASTGLQRRWRSGARWSWAGADRLFERPLQPDADVEALAEGYATLTPLHFDLNHFPKIDRYRSAPWTLNPSSRQQPPLA